MKHTLLITTVLMLTVGYSQETDAKPIDGSTLVWKGGLRYAPDSDKPYSGGAVFDILGPNGQLRFAETYKDGKRDGKYTDWYKNGQKSYEGTYKDGIKDGKWTYWSPDGKESTKLIWKNGVQWDGVGMGGDYNDWIKHGVMEKVESYKNGKRDGKWIEHDFSYTGKEKRSGNYKNGKEDGLETSWYANGQKREERTYKDGEYDGLYTEWYENGQKRGEGTYKDGELISAKCWDWNGNEEDCDELE